MDCPCPDKQRVEERLHHDLKGPSVKLLYCTDCEKYEAIEEDGSWINIENIYKSTVTSASSSEDVVFKQVNEERERLLLYLLSQVSYNQGDIDTESDESPFTLFASDEVAKLCYFQGEVVGFYTVKERGSPVESDSDEVFCMTIVDTVYIRKSHRRLGIGTRIVQHIVDSYPNQYIGFSNPLSESMCKLLKKYLKKNTRLRDQMWLCSYTGEEGYRANIWLELCANRRISESF